MVVVVVHVVHVGEWCGVTVVMRGYAAEGSGGVEQRGVMLS